MHILIVVEDSHAEPALRQALASAKVGAADIVVLTADALLAMRLERERIDGVVARRTISGMEDPRIDTPDGNPILESRDALALKGAETAFGGHATFDGTDFAPYLQYTLIPTFMHTIRNVTAVLDQLTSATPDRMLLVGGGALVAAARLVAAQRSIPFESFDASVLSRARQGVARLRAGRTTRWVDTAFRALVLEPGFQTLMFLKGFWTRITHPLAQPPHRNALIVVGDRFTAEVIERLRGGARPLVLAGATQPGRSLFASTQSLAPIESFSRWGDLLRIAATAVDAAARALTLACDREHGRAFVVRDAAGDICYWRLVRRPTALHILIWIQQLRHLQTLAARAAQASSGGRLLTSSDVTAYNRVLIDTVRRFGVASTGIQHGLTAEPNGHTMVHVDTLAIWGPQAEWWHRDLAAALGRVQRAQFVVTGSPRLDALAARVASRHRGAASQAPAADGTTPFTVCICTGFMSHFSTGASDAHNLVMIDVVFEWARSQAGVRVIHKMHPGEELEFYAAAAQALGWDPLTLRTTREPRLYDILEQSDVLVTSYSSTVLESLVLGTPAIVFDGLVRRRLLHKGPTPLGGVPGVAVAYSNAELRALLDARRSAPQPDRASLGASAQLQQYLSGLDGAATARVAALLE